MSERIRSREVLTQILLEVLYENPEGLTPPEVYDYIDRRYRFPRKWYRQLPEGPGYRWLEEHGYDDWRTVPQEKLIELVKTESQWKNEVRWARNTIRKQGYLDTTAPRGVWRLNSSGINLIRGGEVLSLTSIESEMVERFKKEPAVVDRLDTETSTLSATTRTSLLGTLQLLTHSMPIDDLDLLVEIARTIRKKSLSDEENSD